MKYRKVWRSRCCGAGAAGQALAQGVAALRGKQHRNAPIASATPRFLTIELMGTKLTPKHRPFIMLNGDKIVVEAMSGRIGSSSERVTW